MATIAEKQHERGQKIEQARAIQSKADAESRKMSTDEGVEFDRLMEAAEQDGIQIRREQKLAELETDLRRVNEPAQRPEPGEPGSYRAVQNPRATPAYRQIFRQYLLDGPAAIHVMPHEQRATLQMDVYTKGGALVAPEEFVNDLIKAVDDRVFIRQLATKYTVTSAAALGVPTLDADPADADWTTELATGNETDMTFGKRELRPHPLAKRIKVSNKLMRAAAMSPETLVRDRLAYKFAVTQEKAFLTGTGVQQPLGVFTASADGIPTTQDVSTGNTGTAIGADGLIEAKYFLKAAYWPKAEWIFSRAAAKNIRKLKDGNGNYMWAPGLTGGTPDTILDMPYHVSEFAPSTFTTGLYVGILGDFSNYWIVDALDTTIQRLVELYAETNQTGFIGRAEVDAQPVLAEAFVRVKLG